MTETNITNPDDLIVGKSYLVVFFAATGRIEREMRGVFLGADQFTGDLDFSLRPDFGTTPIRREQFDAAIEQKGRAFAPRRRRQSS